MKKVFQRIHFFRKVITFFTLALFAATSHLILSDFVLKDYLAYAAFNKEINYQGKLLDGSNATVSDGTYHMLFRLYTTPTGDTSENIWQEDRSTEIGDRVTVTSGLFSVMLGSSTPLTSVNFNQTLYLGVEIGGSGDTPSWDGEMSPRKKIGAVPAAFESAQLEGLNSAQFLRSDAVNATSSGSTFFTATQNGAGNIVDLYGPNSTLTFTALSSGNIGIGTSSPYAKLSVVGEVVGSYFTATSTSATSTFPYLSATQSALGTVISGTWNGTAIADGYLTKTGDWTGTLDGQEGSYYLNANNQNNFGERFYSYFSATTTDALTEGSSNCYYTATRFDNRLSATTSLPNITQLSNLATVGTIASGVWRGTAIEDGYITKSGNWTGTFDGQEGSYYLNAANLTNFGTPFYTFFNATTTDALAQGSTNKYYSNACVNAYIHASTTIPKTYTSNNFRGTQTFCCVSVSGTLDGAGFTNAWNDAFNATTTWAGFATNFSDSINNIRGVANGIAGLDASGKVPTSQLPSLAITSTFVVDDFADTAALNAQTGDVAVVVNENKSYILQGTDPSVPSDWTQLRTPENTVMSVNGLTGAVTLTTSNITEGSNLYYTDARADARITAQKGQVNGLATLGADGKIPTSQMGSLPVNNVSVVVSEAAMLALDGSVGDMAVRTDQGKTYVLQSTPATELSNWVELLNSAAVTSVNGSTGAVTLTTTAISEGTNQYWTQDRFDTALIATTTWASDLTVNGGNLGVGIAPGTFALNVLGNASSSGSFYAGEDLYVGHSSLTDNDAIYFDQGLESLIWNNSNDRFEISNDLSVTGTTTATNLQAATYSDLGTVIAGTWNGTAIGDSYLTKTGDWTGTLDGQEGSYYLNANNLNNFGERLYSYFSATTTDALAEGSSNCYYTETRFDNRLSATTSLPNITQLSNLATVGTITSGTWNGTALGAAYGGTGSTTLSGILKGNGTGQVQTAVAGTDYQVGDATLTSLAAYNTNGILVQTTGDTFAGRTITGTTNRLTVTNGDGVSGNPTLDISASYVGQSSITTLGTIVSGTWNGSVVGTTYGGTGVSSFGGTNTLLYTTTANTLSSITTANSSILVTSGAGAPSWATTLPAYTLGGNITGNSQCITGLAQFTVTGTTATSTLSTGGLTVGTSHFAVQQGSGCVGVGTACPQNLFHVNNASASASSTARFTNGSSGSTATDGFVVGVGTDNNAWMWSHESNSLIFGTAAAERMRIDSTGKVGIGTTSPYVALGVNGEIVGTKFTASCTAATSTLNGGLVVGPTGTGLVYDFSTGVTSIDNAEIGALSFDSDAGIVSWADLPVTSSAVVGTVESYSAQIDGNAIFTVYGEADGVGGVRNLGVGVGTTTPYARLSVTGASNATTTFAVAPFGSSQTADVLHLYNTSGLSTVFTAAGRLGVGSTTPWGLLSVNPSGVTGPAFVVGSSTATNFIVTNAGIAGVGTTSPWATFAINPIGNTASNAFVVGSSSATRFLIDNSGAVGIGTTSPAEQLSVANRLFVGGTGTSTFQNNLGVLGTLKVGTGSMYITSTSVNSGDGALYLATTGTSTLPGGLTLSAGNVNVPTGGSYLINNANVLSGTTLGSSVVNSSLTSVGTITSGTWTGTAVGVAYGGTGLTSTPTYGQVLVGNALGGYTLTATSSLGISGGGSGTVNSGTAGQISYYNVTGTAVSGTSTITIDTTTSLVGIGTTSPVRALDVCGDLAITGKYYVGYNPVLDVNVGLANTFIGVGAGCVATVGICNTFVGNSSGTLSPQGDCNSYFGAQSGYFACGSNNTGLGFCAGYINTGSENSFIGFCSGTGNTGSFNIIGGTLSGNTNTGSCNVILGLCAGGLNCGNGNYIGGLCTAYSNTGCCNTIFGLLAGNSNAGNDNLIAGTCAAHSNAGSCGVFLGLGAGVGNIGYGSFIGGICAGCGNTANTSNIIGYWAGIGNQGHSNNALGSFAGSGTVGGCNNAIGFCAGATNTGLENIFIGSCSGFNNGGSYTTGIGFCSGISQSGCNNFYGGPYSGASSIHECSVGIGYFTGFSGCGSCSVMLGDFAGAYSCGTNNFMWGYYGGCLNSGNCNFIAGYNAAISNTGSCNTFVGICAGHTNSGADSVMLGTCAGVSNSGSRNIFLGIQAGANSTAGANTIIGLCSGQTNTGCGNLILGNFAGYQNCGCNNAMVGYFSGCSVTATACYNNFFGYGTGYCNTGSCNTVIGMCAGCCNSGANNEIVGMKSGWQNSGSVNTLIGYGVGCLNTGSCNIVMGYLAGCTNSGNCNIVIGTCAACGNSGSGNIFIGNMSGSAGTSGSSITLIGQCTNVCTASILNATAIGCCANACTNDSIILGGTGTYTTCVGIGTSTPAALFAMKQEANTVNGGFWIEATDGSYRSIYMDTSGNLNFDNISTNGYLDSNGAWIDSSDISYKENISTVTDGLSLIKSLTPRRYTMKATGDSQIGFIAQEIKTVVPEVVTGENGRMGIAYGHIEALTVSALKDIASVFSIDTASTSTPSVVSKFTGTTTPIYIDSIGNVGIGSESTASKLSVNGALCLLHGDDSADCDNEAGTLYANQVIVKTADLAENYETADETLGSGEIVSVDGEHSGFIKRAVRAERLPVLGIVSTKPGFTLGGAKGGKPVALSGRVPVKVNLEGGPIAAGDRITLSSVAGVGMKATTTSDTVGVALEPFNPVSGLEGTVLVFAENRQYVALSFESSVGSPVFIDNIKSALRDLGITIKEGVFYLKELVLERLSVKQLIVKNEADISKTGIVIYDRKTGNPVCVYVEDGMVKSQPGDCDATPIPIQNIQNGTAWNDTVQSSSSNSETSTTTTEQTVVSQGTTNLSETSTSSSEPVSGIEGQGTAEAGSVSSTDTTTTETTLITPQTTDTSEQTAAQPEAVSTTEPVSSLNTTTSEPAKEETSVSAADAGVTVETAPSSTQ